MSGSGSIRDTFLSECEELLDRLLEGLGALEASGHDPQNINAIFRAVHSIKGGAGAFGLDELVAFAHQFETLLDMLRTGRLDVEPGLIKALFKATDVLTDLVDASRTQEPADPARVKAGFQTLAEWLQDAPEDEDFEFEALSLDLAPLDLPEEPDLCSYRISFRPTAALFANGHDPLLLFEALAEVGQVSVTAALSGLPSLEAFEWGASYLSWTIDLITDKPECAVHDVFEFVDTLCDLKIERDPDSASTGAKVSSTTRATDHTKSVATPLPHNPMPEDRTATAPAKQTLRVDLDRIDRLINAVGELIINQAMIAQRIDELDLPSMAQLNNEVEGYRMLARDIQEGVMAIRAQPVKSLFQRMARILRDCADETGKPAQLTTSGETTEVDKTVIDRLSEPLTHMLRNAVDHGLEDPKERNNLGKPALGSIHISAAHRSGNVVIEISDDGRGLDRQKILMTAVQKGLVLEGADLSDSEIDNLLFMPGFSTANTVSNLSGRGVGMDVVRNAINALGGRISITATPGKGTTFSVILPLTLAVMDGFVITVCGETMVVPITAIFETVHPRPQDIYQLGTQDLMLLVRGEYIPIIDVARCLGIRNAPFSPASTVLLIVNDETAGFRALAVDDIQDQRQVVVKSLDLNFGQMTGVSAATILGDGKIALILDAEEISDLDGPAPSPFIANTQPLEHLHADRQ